MKPGDLLVFAIPLVLIALLFASQRRRQRAYDATQGDVAVGREVVTTSGLFGRVVDLDDKAAHLEVAPGVVIRWDRRAIGQVLPEATDAGVPPADAPVPQDPSPTDLPPSPQTPPQTEK